jgi:hypothetical protein
MHYVIKWCAIFAGRALCTKFDNLRLKQCAESGLLAERPMDSHNFDAFTQRLARKLLSGRPFEHGKGFADIHPTMDTWFLSLSTAIVLAMHAGFAFLELGTS